jgi:hypothetical protein
VTSLRKHYTNWRNAQSSAGPRTAAGKALGAECAQAGLAGAGTARSGKDKKDIGALARKLAGATADAQRFGAACRLVAAQIDLLDIREARLPLLSRALDDRTAPNAWRRLTAMRPTRARSASPRPGGSAPYVLQWTQAAGEQVPTPAATRSILRPCCSSLPCVGYGRKSARGAYLRFGKRRDATRA